MTLNTAASGRLEILITTYTTYKQNEEKINMINWDAVIADECHIIKERKSDVTEKMALVNSRVRIGLTGTAIQNNYEVHPPIPVLIQELWTLLDWTNPGRVGSLTEWKNKVAKPLRIGQSHDANNKQLSAARKIAMQLKTHLLPRFLLRRYPPSVVTDVERKHLLKINYPRKRIKWYFVR
jgi:SNF2 family DNA or RNA helicase